MKSMKYLFVLCFLTLDIYSFGQDTLKYLQGFEEVFLPQVEESNPEDSLYERYLVFQTADLQRLDSIEFIYYSEKSLIYSPFETYNEQDGLAMLKAGKTREHNNYSVVVYVKPGEINPFVLEKTGSDPFERIPVKIAVDSTSNEEEYLF